jgi:hypothetical protein
VHVVTGWKALWSNFWQQGHRSNVRVDMGQSLILSMVVRDGPSGSRGVGGEGNRRRCV